MKIPIEVIGAIINSQRTSHQIRVSDDAQYTGGFIIYEWWQDSNGPNSNNAFDSWVEDTNSLAKFFQEADWKIQWQSN
jgi:hypothetical protein